MYAREVGYYRVLPLLLPITKSLSYFPWICRPLPLVHFCLLRGNLGLGMASQFLNNSPPRGGFGRRVCAELVLMLVLMLMSHVNPSGLAHTSSGHR